MPDQVVELPADDMIVEIKPEDMQLGNDSDGLPKTVPGGASGGVIAKVAPVEAKPELDVELLTKQLAESRDLADQLRRQRASEAAEAQARIAEARKAADTAVDERDRTTNVAMNAHWERLQEGRLASESGMAAANTAIENASRDIATAMESNDPLKMINAQRALARAEATLMELEKRKADFDDKIEQARVSFSERTQAQREAAHARAQEAQRRAQAPPKQPTVDEWIDQFPGKTAAWLRANRDYVTDTAKHNAFIDFSRQWAQDYGKETWHSPPFIEALEKQFGTHEDDGRDPAPEPAQRQQQAPREAPTASRAAPRATAAPASRGTGQYYSSTNPNSRTVRLPPDLARFVRETGLDPQLYAQGILDDIQAGRKPANWLDPDYPRFT